MATINVLDSAGLTVAIEKPLPPGRVAAAAARPVALSTEDKAALDALATQTTAAAILAKIIAAPGTEAKQDAAIVQETAINTVLGTTAGAAVTTSVAGTIQGYLRGIVSLLVSGITVAAHAVTQSGTWTVQPGNTANTTAWKVDGSAVTQPVSIATAPVLVAGSALIGKVGLDQTTPGTTNAVAIASPAGTRVETTVAAGGTASALFGTTPTNGFEVVNTHATEWLYIRESGSSATVADNSVNIPIAPRGSYTSPVGYKPVADVSYIATTTGHAVIGRRW